MALRRFPILVASLAGLFTLTGVPLFPEAAPGEWPGWRGPGRDGISKETGLLKKWPKDGPPLAWRATGLGDGYSSVSVAGGRIFTMGNVGKDERVIALDEKDGKEVWSVAIGPAQRVDYSGPRATPTLDGELLYTLGVGGDLVCLETAGGKERWRKNLRTDFGGHRPNWGFAESPLVDGDRVLATPGGKDATIVALKKASGELIWKAKVPAGNRRSAFETRGEESDGAQYSSSIKAPAPGGDEYIQLLRTGVAGVSAKDGKFLWRYNKPANGTANISTPIFHDNFVFAATGYGTGGGLVKLTAADGGVKAEEVYFVHEMQNQHGGMILVGEHLYGFDEGTLRCLEFKTKKQAWEARSVGKGSLVFADGHLYARSESGPVALVEATPQAYVEKGRFQQPDRSKENAWPHPVVAGGKLYLRDQDLLLVYDVKEGAARQEN